MDPSVSFENLPTPISKCVARQKTSPGGLYLFTQCSYTFEAFVKYGCCLILAGLEKQDEERAHELEHELSRASSLGTWHSVLEHATAAIVGPSSPQWLLGSRNWATKKHRGAKAEAWFNDLTECCMRIVRRLREDGDEWDAELTTVLQILGFLVYLRNKTRGHGAKPASFYEAHDRDYDAAIDLIVSRSPLMSVPLVARIPSRFGECALLRGPMPSVKLPIPDGFPEVSDSILFILPEESGEPSYLGPLLLFDFESDQTWFANGAFDIGTEKMDFVDYVTGSTRRIRIPRFTAAPVTRRHEVKEVTKFSTLPEKYTPVFDQRHNHLLIADLRGRIPSLIWHDVELTPEQLPRTPEVPGVYCLVSHSHCAGLRAHKIIGYVGRAPNLRKRFGDYLQVLSGELAQEGVSEFLVSFPDVHFCYSTVETTEDRENLQRWLVKAIGPPANAVVRSEQDQSST